MSIKLPVRLLIALALVLLLLAVLLGFAVLHTAHPVLQYALTVNPDVVSHSH